MQSCKEAYVSTYIFLHWTVHIIPTCVRMPRNEATTVETCSERHGQNLLRYVSLKQLFGQGDVTAACPVPEKKCNAMKCTKDSQLLVETRHMAASSLDMHRCRRLTSTSSSRSACQPGADQKLSPLSHCSVRVVARSGY